MKTNELNFIETDAQAIGNYILYVLSNELKEDLYPGDERKIFAEAITMLFTGMYNTFNDSARQIMLRYARGSNLDGLGSFPGVIRLEAVKAKTTIRFYMTESIQDNVVIPKGTRVTSDYTRYFATNETVILKENTLEVLVSATAETNGINSNGIAIGAINVLVDLIQFIDGVENTEVSYGGSEIEDDESYRERIRIAPQSRTTAGPISSYRYYALSADPNITDVSISSPTPGTVKIVPILIGGELPTEDILNKVYQVCNQEDVRPLTDLVVVETPKVEYFDINFTYFSKEEVSSEVIETVEGVGGAVDQYILWQSSQLNQDINPDYLRKLILSPEDAAGNNLVGADRIILVSPTYTEISSDTVAKFSGTKTINYVSEG